MSPDPTSLVRAMARREAAAALLPPPYVQPDAQGTPVRVRLQACPDCGAREHHRDWAPPFGDGTAPGLVLDMLACETVTARAVLPIVVAAERSPGLGNAEYRTRALTWLEVSHLELAEALAAMDASERWVEGPAAAGVRTLPASTRLHRNGDQWVGHRQRLVPSFLSPHPSVPASFESLYAEELRTQLVAGYERTCAAS